MYHLSKNLIRLIVISVLVGLPWIIWLYFYWPTRTQIGIPIYFNYDNNIPTYTTNVTTKYGYYDLDLELITPTSETNQNLGPFMIYTGINYTDSSLFNSIRPGLLIYKSNLSHMIRDISFCLLDLFGFTQQKNTNSYNLGKNLLIFQSPLKIELKINNNNIQIYQAIFWLRQRSISWFWLIFYIVMLVSYLVFFFGMVILLVRNYLRLQVQTDRRARIRRKMITDKH